MGLILYHYVHCPYCVRVRMALGYLNLPYESRPLAYDDSKTPTDLIGVKMLPVMSFDKVPMKESLDIIRKIDQTNKLKCDLDLSSIESFIKDINNSVHSLVMPYWMQTSEFTPSARAYFQKQKEEKRGPFKDLINNSGKYKEELKPLLNSLEQKLKPYFESSTLTLKDIMIAAHLWGLYVVPEYQFSEKIHSYLQTVKESCHFNYHQDLWS